MTGSLELSEPLGVCRGAVVVLGGFEEFEFAVGGGGGGAGKQGIHLGLVEGFEGACGFEGLVEDLRVVDAGDDDGDGQGEGRSPARVVKSARGLTMPFKKLQRQTSVNSLPVQSVVATN